MASWAASQSVNTKPVLSKNEFYRKLFEEDEEWRALAGQTKASEAVQSFLQRFYNRMCSEYDVKYSIGDIKCRLIVTERQKCSFHQWNTANSNLYFDVITSSVPNFSEIILGQKFRGICHEFVSVIIEDGRLTFSFQELADLYKNSSQRICSTIGETALTGVMDVIAKLVSLDFLIHHDSKAKVDSMPRPSIQTQQQTHAEGHSGLDRSARGVPKDEVRHIRQKGFMIDQHYGERKSQNDSRAAEDDSHLPNKLISKLIKYSSSADAGDKGVTITSDKDDPEDPTKVSFGCLQVDAEEIATFNVDFKESSPHETLLIQCLIVKPSTQFKVLGAVNQQVREIKKGNSFCVQVSYTSSEVGMHTNVFGIVFRTESEDVFVITRNLIGHTESEDMEDLRATGPYVSPKPFITAQEKDLNIIKGVPPEVFGNMDTKVGLKKYEIPKDLVYNLNKGQGRVTGGWLDLIQEPLSRSSNYKKKFSALLHLEEIQAELDIKRYAMEDVTLTSAHPFLVLRVPGLAEGRPSLIVGDRVLAAKRDNDGNTNKTRYEGCVHQVQEEQIYLKFKRSFHDQYIKGGKYNIDFVLNRFTQKLMHRALELVDEKVMRTLFPTENSTLSYPQIVTDDQIKRMRIKDRNIEKNLEQLQAVQNIVKGTSRPHPYVIFGPPGTGKTVTMVESMRQVLLLIPNSRVLACAPSNNAADLLLHRLLNPCVIDKGDLFRINALSRAVITVPEHYNILGNCKLADGKFAIPNLAELLKYRVIVSTNTTAGRLISMGFPLGHFTHVFMDESGQAVEPESLISLAGLYDPDCKDGGQIVLAGDPKQLSPILRSPIAIKHGLGISLLERLMKYSLYYRGNNVAGNLGRFDQNFITKLISNYRSHQDILQVPNKLFYDNELIAAADRFKVESLLQWKELPAPDCPIIFHGVQGEDQREKNSPSFFNPHEVKTVVDYVKKLLEEPKLGATPQNIGIISPYRKQVEKIRKLLKADKRRMGMKNIQVGSVEEFQGQEKRIIIISTVRSNRDFLQLDAKFRLGFLKNPKRFNVAVTRAQALLIIVGNPFVLGADVHWDRMLQFAFAKKCYVGCQYQNEGDAIEEITNHLKELGINMESESFHDEIPWERKDV